MKNKLTEEQKEYLSNVKKEIRYLKKNATRKELLQLKFKKLDPSKSYDCIYGQMTGSCYSGRALELIHGLKFEQSFDNPKHWNILNIAPRKISEYQGFTYLEHFIFNYFHNNEHILKYLRNEERYLKISLK